MEALNLISTLAIGLYAGSLLTEGMILVPYWRRMAPADFFRLHGEVGPGLFRYFAPLTAIAVTLAILAATMTSDPTTLRTIAAGLCMLALAIFFIYFRKANASFADHSLAESNLGAELLRWSSWHWTRTILVIAAFGASIGADLW
ncbi:MAG: hypothetical protein AAF950_13790 [Pseudomonadota bacterium]